MLSFVSVIIHLMKCTRCSKEALQGKSLCKLHLIRARIWQWSVQRPECKPYLPQTTGLGRRGNDPIMRIAKQLDEKLKEQEFKCAITGIDISLLTNAEIDHIQSISKQPELAFDINNMRWVDATANKKSNVNKNKNINRTNEHKLLRALARLECQACNWQLKDKNARNLWSQMQKIIKEYKDCVG
jgi:hypothetical protein